LRKPSSQSGLDLASNECALRIGSYDLEKFAQQFCLGSLAQRACSGFVAYASVAPTPGLYDAGPNPSFSRRAVELANCSEMLWVVAFERQEQTVPRGCSGWHGVEALKILVIGEIFPWPAREAHGALQKIRPVRELAIGE